MFERDDSLVQRVIDQLRQPVEMDPTLDTKVMARVSASEVPRAGPIAAAWDWLRRPRAIAVSPLAGLAATAALAGVALWISGRVPQRVAPASGDAVQFVVIAPGAGSVALVGDFNDWDATATPMRPARSGDLWSVTVPLAPGRYRYAFLVNGSRWIVDPAAPRTHDDFDTPSSVVTVGG